MLGVFFNEEVFSKGPFHAKPILGLGVTTARVVGYTEDGLDMASTAGSQSRPADRRLSDKTRPALWVFRVSLLLNALLIAAVAWVFETEFHAGPLYLAAPSLLVALTFAALLGVGASGLRYGLSFLVIGSSIVIAAAHGAAAHVAVMVMSLQGLYLLLTLSYGTFGVTRLSVAACAAGMALGLSYFIGHRFRPGDPATDVLLIALLYQPPTVCMIYFMRLYRETPMMNLAAAEASLAAMQGRLESEHELAQARRELSHVSRSLTLDAFTGALVHELRQPFAAIVMSAAAAQRWMQRGERDETRSAIREAGRAAQRAGAIVGGLRRLIGGDHDARETTDLNRLVEDTLVLLGEDLEKQGVCVTLQLEALVPTDIDRTQIQQVFINLVTNALDAVSSHDQPRRIMIATASADGWTSLSVSDNGPGLSEEGRARAFDAFFTTKPNGAGLGLAICRLAVEEHGGFLQASANTAAGAVFTMRLPTTGGPQPTRNTGGAVSGAASQGAVAVPVGPEPTPAATAPYGRGWLAREYAHALRAMVWQRTPAGSGAGSAYRLNTIFNLVLVSVIAWTFETEFSPGPLYLVAPVLLSFLMATSLLGRVFPPSRALGHLASFTLTSSSLVIALAHSAAAHAAVMLMSYQGLFLLLIMSYGAVAGGRYCLLSGGAGVASAASYFIGHPFQPGDGATDLLMLSALALPPSCCLTYYIVSHREALGASIARAESELQATERSIEAEQALTQVRRELSRIDRSLSLGALSAALVHELSQPLAAIAANAAAADRWMEQDEPEEAKRVIHDAARAAERASEIVGGLRRLIGSDVGQRGLIDLNRLVDDTLPLVREDLEARNIVVNLQLGVTTPVEIDAIQMQQVLVNLISNAADTLCGQDGPRRVAITTKANAGWTIFTVADNGPVLSETARRQLFDALSSARQGGDGLRLAICREVVESHGGTIECSANRPTGAVFTVRLPPGHPAR